MRPNPSPRGTAGASAPQSRHPSNVRYVSPAELRRIFGDIDFAECWQLEDMPALRPTRHVVIGRLNAFDKLCIAVALLSLAWFVVRLAVGALS